MRKKSFTLIEILIVILIIGILASLLTVGINHYKDKAKDVRAKENMNQIRISASKIYDTQGGYESALLCCSSGCSDEVKTNCEEIKKMTGSYPDIYTDDNENYCAKVQLNSGKWFCIDSQGSAIEKDSVICSPANLKCE